jgi:hypothetical protein
MDPTFLNRNVNEGFSGGEKKRNEILQLAVLEVRSAADPPQAVLLARLNNSQGCAQQARWQHAITFEHA